MNHKISRLACSLTALIALALVAVTSPARALDLAFQRTWGGISREDGQGVAVGLDGSYYLVGHTASFGTGVQDGDLDLVLVKYDPSGAILWQRTYGVGRPEPFANASEFAADVAVAPDGSIWVTGEQFGKTLLVQFDPQGNLLNEVAVAGADSPRALDVAADGSIYVTGFVYPGAGQGDAYLMKLTSTGAVVWLRTWGAAQGFEIGNDVVASPAGGVYIAGSTNGFSGADAFLVKFDSEGGLVWERTWREAGELNEAQAEGVALGPDGSVYLTGSSMVFGDGPSAFLVKFSPAGSLVWERAWEGKGGSGATGIAVGSDGTISITGAITDRTDDTNIFVVQFQPDGRVRQASTWGGAAQDFAQAVAAAPDGSILIAGSTFGPPPYSFKKALKKTRTPVSVLGIPAGEVTSPTGAASDPNGIVLVPTGSERYAGDSDAVLIKIVP